MGNASTTREKLLQAAGVVVQEKGVSQLTLESVAKQAGVSKGGLLYHFPNKEALIRAMVDYLMQLNTHTLLEHKTQGSDKGHFVRAFLETTEVSPKQRELSAGLIAAFVTNPELLQTVREHYQNWQERVENDGIDPALATVVRLASDGIFFADLFQLAPPSGDLRRQVFLLLEEMTRGEEDGGNGETD
ncbi:TetR/AcrR family transcriptional regulator [Risungbinella massiliensis]|uniref:TetR/AcrR family transcriptional regulator n=1 Tax=Risungbinella massiliensis TaxID=1329796 RepID=UPI0005CBF40C|nr:TetR/AcrR family transcriptional regulator [Risungbinella massiliensis]